MLTVLLLLSKYRLRNVPVIEPDEPVIRNFITQAGVVKGLQQCKGRDWFDYISALPLADLGLPFMSIDEVILHPPYSSGSLKFQIFSARATLLLYSCYFTFASCNVIQYIFKCFFFAVDTGKL
jgi:hypothetical protein